MIDISPAAVVYFSKLLGREETPGMGLRISVIHPGTARADCQLEFCAPGDALESDLAFSYDSFQLYVAVESEGWLREASIDYLIEGTSGQLTIKAPGLKGRAPEVDAPLDDRVRWVLEQQVNPQVASHGGHISLVEVTAEKAVILRFGGGCQGCGMAHVTLKQGVEKTLLEELPEITAVRDVTDHQAGVNPYYN